MLQEYLHADADQDEAAQDFRVAAEARLQPASQKDADQGHGETHHADDNCGEENLSGEDAEGEPHSERVDARSDGKNHEPPSPGRVGSQSLFIRRGNALPDHPQADEEKQTQRNVVVPGRYRLYDARACEVACQEEEGLEEPEMEAESEHAPLHRGLEHGPRPHTHCKGVHAETNGNEDRFQAHIPSAYIPRRYWPPTS